MNSADAWNAKMSAARRSAAASRSAFKRFGHEDPDVTAFNAEYERQEAAMERRGPRNDDVVSRSQQRRTGLIKCGYGECTFQGTQAEVDEHVVYLIGIGDPEHAADKLRERH